MIIYSQLSEPIKIYVMKCKAVTKHHLLVWQRVFMASFADALLASCLAIFLPNRGFKKLLRRRQQERHKTIGFNEKDKDPAHAF